MHVLDQRIRCAPGTAGPRLSLMPRVCKPYSDAERRADDCTAARTLPRLHTPAGALGICNT